MSIRPVKARWTRLGSQVSMPRIVLTKTGMLGSRQSGRGTGGGDNLRNGCSLESGDLPGV